jgi:hypothetical protein
VQLIKTKLKQQPDGFYPDGRHPWRDLYKDDVIAELSRILKIDSDTCQRLRYELGLLAEQFVTRAAENNLQISPTRRIKWLKSRVLEPALILRTAIDFDHWPILCDPRDIMFTARRPILAGPQHWKGGELSGQLDAMIKWTEELISQLSDRKPGTKTTTAFKQDLVDSLLQIYCVLFPDKKPTRTHFKTTSRREAQSSSQGEFADFVRCAARPILGSHDLLSHQIQTSIRRNLVMKKMITR